MSEDDRYVAVPRFYDKDEYWDLSGLVWDQPLEPFEDKKPDPDVTDE